MVDLASPLKGYDGLCSHLHETDDPTALRAQLALLRAALGSLVRDQVLTNPDVARVVLVNALTGIVGELSVVEERSVLIAQQLYACLLSLGPITLHDPIPALDDAAATWMRDTLELMASFSMVCSEIDELDSGMVGAAHLHDGVVETEMTDLGLWALEVNLNAIRTAPTPDLAHLKPVDAIERAVFGRSITELLLLAGDVDSLRQLTYAELDDGLLVIDLAISHPVLDAMKHWLVLTDDQWRGHALPAYFLADDRPDSGSRLGTLIKAASVDWLRYTPLLLGTYGPVAARRPLAFTTPALLTRALTRAAASAAGRVERAARAAAGTPAAIATNAAARTVHSAFEQTTAQVCRDGGALAEHSVAEIAKRPLPCGEIDVLALLDTASGPVTLVVECKNVDVTFYKAFGVTQTRDTLRRGTAQALRKGRWITEHWHDVAAELGWPQRIPMLLGVVVTRTLSTPPESDGVVVTRLKDLAGILDTLRTQPRTSWRGDLRTSVLSA